MAGACGRARFIARVIYILLVVLFLVESALPPDVSFRHVTPIANVFTKLSMRPDLTAQGGESISRHTLSYDEVRGVGEVIRLIPEGASALSAVECKNRDILKIERHETEAQGVFYIAYACGVGEATLSLTGTSGEVTRTREIKVRVKSAEIGEGAPFGEAVLSQSALTVGDTLTASLIGEATQDTHGTVIWTTTDEAVLKVTNWSYECAAATLTATGAGEVKLRARRLGTGELLYEAAVTVTPKDTYVPLSVEREGGGELPSVLRYDVGRRVGEVIFAKIRGSAASVTSSDESVIRIERSGSELLAISAGIGTATVTVCSETADESVVLPIMVEAGELPYTGAYLKASLPEIREGDFFTLTLLGTEVPYIIEADGEGLEISESLSDAVKIKAEECGEYELIAKNPSHGTELCRIRVTVDKGPFRVEFLDVYGVVRKSLGHFAFCMAIGFMLYCGFGTLERRALAALGISSIVLVSVVSELIQWGVGRKCAALDMLINATGFTIGFLLSLAAFKSVNLIRKKRNKNDTGKRKKKEDFSAS